MFPPICVYHRLRFKFLLTKGRDTSFEGHHPPLRYVEPSDPRTYKVPGPLMTNALVSFEKGSWLSTAANYESKMPPNTTDWVLDRTETPFQLLCRGMPFSKLQAPLDIDFRTENDFVGQCGSIDQRIFDGGKAHEVDLLRAMRYYLSVFAPISRGRTLNNPENLLNTAMFVANRAHLNLVSPEVGHKEKDLTGRLIYASPGVAVHRPALSNKVLPLVSILIAFQLVALGYLTYYLYRVPSWSNQLDAMAMARIGASLHHRGMLPSIGPVSKEDLATLQTFGGLVGIVEKSPRRESSMARSLSPEPVIADDSDMELQRLTPTGDGCKNFKHVVTHVELGLDAPGPILATDLSRRSQYVLGLKRVCRGILPLRKRSSADDK
jgi:hypothetical protein